MAIGSGLGASFGFSPESTYGTYVAPARWWPGTQFFAAALRLLFGASVFDTPATEAEAWTLLDAGLHHIAKVKNREAPGVPVGPLTLP